MTTIHTRRAIASAASLAVAAAGFAALAPAAQAESAALAYTCKISLFDGEKLSVVVDTDLPDTVKAGSSTPVKVTANVSLAEAKGGALPTLRNLNAASVLGSAEVGWTLDGAEQKAAVLSIPSTVVPAAGALALTATGPAAAFAPTQPGTYVIKAGAFTGKLDLKKANGQPTDLINSADIACAPNAGQDLTVDTVQVTAGDKPTVATSVTKAKAKYAKKKKSVSASATVKASGKAASGKVKFTLKRGKKVVRVSTKTLNKKGVAKATFKKVSRKGTYTLTAKYAGSKTVKASKKVVTFKVR